MCGGYLMKNSKTRLKEAQQKERFLRKTLINDFISLKETIMMTDDDNEIYNDILKQEEKMVNLFPDAENNIEKLETLKMNFDDFDTPIDFSENKKEQK